MPKSVFVYGEEGRKQQYAKKARIALPECVVLLALYRHGVVVS
jgi:hypothetical protein